MEQRQSHRNIVSVTLGGAVKSFLSTLLPPKEMKIGIDVSRYQPVLKAEELKGNIDFMIAKAVEVDDRVIGWNQNNSVDAFCTDPAILNQHAQVAYDLNIPFGIYLFDNPAYKMSWGARAEGYPNWPSADALAETKALRQAAGTKMMYHGIFIDVERWWYSYAQYYADQATAVKVPATWIRDSAAFLEYRILEDMKAGNLRNVPIIYYTGKWFVDAYCPLLDTFLANRKQWLAAYPQPLYGNAPKFTTWSELRTAIGLVNYTPAWIGNKDCELHQMGDNAKLPGVYDKDGKTKVRIDYNRARVPLKDIFAPGRWSDGIVTPPPPPPAGSHTIDEVYQQISELAVAIRGLKDDTQNLRDDVAAVRGHFK